MKGRYKDYCDNARKKRFSTKKSAMTAVSRVSTFRTNLKLYYYKCPFCKGYHLTKNKQNKEEQQA